MVLCIAGHFTDLLRQFHEGVILHTRAGRTSNDVQLVTREVWNGAETTGLDIGQNLETHFHFLMLTGVG